MTDDVVVKVHQVGESRQVVTAADRVRTVRGIYAASTAVPFPMAGLVTRFIQEEVSAER